MKNLLQTENRDNHELPASAQRAFESYPQIQASPDFNRRVLERVLSSRAPSKLELFCDRMDEIFARPILKLIGAASLGGIIALAGSGLLIKFSMPSTPAATPVANAPLSAQLNEELLSDSHNRLALMRELEMPYVLRSEYSNRQWRDFHWPAKREKSMEETDANKRSSQCPAAFRLLV